MPGRSLVRSSYRCSLGNAGFDRHSGRPVAIVATEILQQDAGEFADQLPDAGIAALPASIQLISRPIAVREYLRTLHIRYRSRAFQFQTKAFRIRDLRGSTTEPGFACPASH